ncbi:hypothetical protein DFJ74DRAFT_657082 [Hyaloraphidium curvatum]|nr:hypothetical protein DFJ74DRAFT_657082 [Hyaloraphidium curvatum]
MKRIPSSHASTTMVPAGRHWPSIALAAPQSTNKAMLRSVVLGWKDAVVPARHCAARRGPSVAYSDASGRSALPASTARQLASIRESVMVTARSRSLEVRRSDDGVASMPVAPVANSSEGTCTARKTAKRAADQGCDHVRDASVTTGVQHMARKPVTLMSTNQAMAESRSRGIRESRAPPQVDCGHGHAGSSASCVSRLDDSPSPPSSSLAPLVRLPTSAAHRTMPAKLPLRTRCLAREALPASTAGEGKRTASGLRSLSRRA